MHSFNQRRQVAISRQGHVALLVRCSHRDREVAQSAQASLAQDAASREIVSYAMFFSGSVVAVRSP